MIMAWKQSCISAITAQELFVFSVVPLPFWAYFSLARLLLQPSQFYLVQLHCKSLYHQPHQQNIYDCRTHPVVQCAALALTAGFTPAVIQLIHMLSQL